jgi:nitrate reductase gamma subunit
MEVMLGVSAYTLGFLLIFFSACLAWQYARLPKHSLAEVFSRVPEKHGLGLAGNRFGLFRNMLWDMVKKMLGFEKFLDKGKPFWWLSSCFRLGVWLMGAWTLFLILGALAQLAGVAVDAHASLGTGMIYYLTIPLGVGGFALATFGVAALILQRMNDPILRKNLSVQDFFDLILTFTVLMTGLLLWGGDLSFTGARAMMAQVLSFSLVSHTNPLLMIHLVLLNVMIVYVPLSQMISFSNRYFVLREAALAPQPASPGEQPNAENQTAE